ncbi:MAG: hypothetical protein AAF907_11390 [Planctomycetota bacterium]
MNGPKAWGTSAAGRRIRRSAPDSAGAGRSGTPRIGRRFTAPQLAFSETAATAVARGG